jgi:hypothetical protein
MTYIAKQKGFLCYVHDDDGRDEGRLVQLARDVVDEFEMLTGERIELFIDRESIAWGEVWRDTIDGSLADVAFFIPMVTPRFFDSPECRREFEEFERQASFLGVEKLILPIMYVNVPGFSDMQEDRVVKALERLQYEPWHGLRYADRLSERYREAVGSLATKLVSRLAEVDSKDVISHSGVLADGSEDTWLESLAMMESAMPEIERALEGISEDVPQLGTELENATNAFQEGSASHSPFAARLTVARKLALALDPHIESLEGHTTKFSNSFADIDGGVRVLLEQVRERHSSADGLTELDSELITSVRYLATMTAQQYAAIAGAQAEMVPLEQMSRDLKPRIRRINVALNQMGDAHAITEGWGRLLQELPTEDA